MISVLLYYLYLLKFIEILFVIQYVTGEDCICQNQSEQYFWSHMLFQNFATPHEQAESICPSLEHEQQDFCNYRNEQNMAKVMLHDF